jgi:hypothetical protein
MQVNVTRAHNLDLRSQWRRLCEMHAASDAKASHDKHGAKNAKKVHTAILCSRTRPASFHDSLPMATHNRRVMFPFAACHPPYRTTLAVTLVCCALTAHAAADDIPSVTPYRPSVSSPAALSAPGWLEVEAGVQSSNAVDPTRRQTLPYTLKLAFTPDWGIRIGGDAFVRQRNADGTTDRGFGDTSLVLKRRFAVDDASAFGAELGVKFPTARDSLGSGHTDVGLNGIYSSDFAGDWHVDINLMATHLGGVDAGTSAWQKGWAGSLSRNLNDKWSAGFELSGTQRRGADSTAQALVSTSYSLSPGAVIDFGVSKGLNNASGGWSVFSGITFLAARLF